MNENTLHSSDITEKKKQSNTTTGCVTGSIRSKEKKKEKLPTAMETSDEDAQAIIDTMGMLLKLCYYLLS